MSLVHCPHRLHHRGKWSSRSHGNPVSHFRHLQTLKSGGARPGRSSSNSNTMYTYTNIHDRLQRDTRLQRTKDPTTSYLKPPRCLSTPLKNNKFYVATPNPHSHQHLWRIAQFTIITPGLHAKCA